MNRLHYDISGILNAVNKTQVKNALDKVKGVDNISVNLLEGTIDVEYGDPADESQIRDCIENTGFKIE